jgi:hypothetical protein
MWVFPPIYIFYVLPHLHTGHADIVEFPGDKIGMVPFEPWDFYHFRYAKVGKKKIKLVSLTMDPVLETRIFL